jgi:hypothetical protein
MFKDWSYAEVELKAEAIKELGLEEVYLSVGDKPWHLATSCEPGGSHRLDISTSVWFRAVSPSGIPLRWSFDIELQGSNGKGGYYIDTDGCRKVLSLLSEPCLSQFRQYLSDCADAVAKQVTDWEREIERERKVVADLRAI